MAGKEGRGRRARARISRKPLLPALVLSVDPACSVVSACGGDSTTRHRQRGTLTDTQAALPARGPVK